MTSMLIRPRKPGHCCRVFVPKRGGCRVTRALLAAFALAWRLGACPATPTASPSAWSSGQCCAHSRRRRQIPVQPSAPERRRKQRSAHRAVTQPCSAISIPRRRGSMEPIRSARRVFGGSAAACAIAAIPEVASAAADPGHAGSAGSGVPPAAAVPKGFRATAMSWTSASHGWVLGTEQCGAKYGNCRGSQVIGTTNGGQTWHLVGKLTASIPKLGQGGAGITEIRFGTDKAGWAFGPGLYRTAGGGRTWKPVRVPGGGKQVIDLAVTPTSGYVVASPCGFDVGDQGGAALRRKPRIRQGRQGGVRVAQHRQEGHLCRNDEPVGYPGPADRIAVWQPRGRDLVHRLLHRHQRHQGRHDLASGNRLG